jgi:hypothetical protein
MHAGVLKALEHAKIESWKQRTRADRELVSRDFSHGRTGCTSCSRGINRGYNGIPQISSMRATALSYKNPRREGTEGPRSRTVRRHMQRSTQLLGCGWRRHPGAFLNDR